MGVRAQLGTYFFYNVILNLSNQCRAMGFFAYRDFAVLRHSSSSRAMSLIIHWKDSRNLWNITKAVYVRISAKVLRENPSEKLKAILGGIFWGIIEEIPQKIGKNTWEQSWRIPVEIFEKFLYSIKFYPSRFWEDSWRFFWWNTW